MDQKNRLTINTFVRGRYSAGIKNCIIDYLLIDVCISNSSNSTIRFWSYSCDYNLIFVLNDPKYSIIYNNCDANYSKLIELKPKQAYQVPLMVKLNNPGNATWSDFKVGFVSVFESQHNLKLDLEKIIDKLKKNGEQIVWSNKVVTNPANRNPYIIE